VVITVKPCSLSLITRIAGPNVYEQRSKLPREYWSNMYNRADYTAPTWVLDELDAWGRTAAEPHRFIRAVLENNLRMAMAYADPVMRSHLHSIITYVECQLPAGCKWSKENVENWKGSEHD
jgi:hypothetical protein